MNTKQWNISDWLMASGPVTYIIIWIIVLILLLMYEFSYETRCGMIAYAALPVGAICQTSIGWCLSLVGI